MKAIPHAFDRNFNNFGGLVQNVTLVFILPLRVLCRRNCIALNNKERSGNNIGNRKRYAGCNCFVASEILLDYVCRTVMLWSRYVFCRLCIIRYRLQFLGRNIFGRFGTDFLCSLMCILVWTLRLKVVSIQQEQSLLFREMLNIMSSDVQCKFHLRTYSIVTCTLPQMTWAYVH